MARRQSVQEQVLAAAQRLCETRDDWTFTPAEVVRSLPGVAASTVRTEVTGRCCVNAPAHHARRWPYFRRVDRGRYRVEPAFRQAPPVPSAERRTRAKAGPAAQVAESAPPYGDGQPRARARSCTWRYARARDGTSQSVWNSPS